MEHFRACARRIQAPCAFGQRAMSVGELQPGPTTNKQGLAGGEGPLPPAMVEQLRRVQRHDVARTFQSIMELSPFRQFCMTRSGPKWFTCGCRLRSGVSAAAGRPRSLSRSNTSPSEIDRLRNGSSVSVVILAQELNSSELWRNIHRVLDLVIRLR